MKEKEAVVLDQLVKTMEQVSLKMKDSYEKKDVVTFLRLKKFLFKINERIDEILDGR